MRNPSQQRPPTAHRTKPALGVGLVVAACAIAGCSSVSISVVDGSSDTWTVAVADPRFGSEDTCSNDPSVERAFSTADLPSSRLGISLVPGATEDDAHRVATCLQDVLDSGNVTIGRPR
ncbi:hypothetical protein SAMN05216410_3122 [Sanguibacter gelidistatuariae]|uniref:Uncharacterized protein n=1 Tax=Sanguibacter gelidistatuariae TaxID=1814289 RepID=A0A1G6TKP8_9MICO|nr:hypothetical protein [Sanguibacter gelidistatuariae]SDD28987.1 hypothetical protein SAMN05216410_3122 [Sanguibacter gelidistatuariae]